MREVDSAFDWNFSSVLNHIIFFSLPHNNNEKKKNLNRCLWSFALVLTAETSVSETHTLQGSLCTYPIMDISISKGFFPGKCLE